MKRVLLFVMAAGVILSPAFTGAKELPDLSDGKVILLWTDFEKILKEYLREDPEEEPAPPTDYSLQSASYDIQVREGLAEIAASYELGVLNEGWVYVPLGGSDSGINKVLVNGAPGMLKQKSGKVMLLLKDRGLRKVVVRHTVKAPQKPGPNSFSIPLFPVPGASFKLTAPALLSDISIDGAVITDKQKKDEKWSVQAVSGTINDLRISYSVPSPEAADAEKEEVPPKVYSTSQTLLTISDEVSVAEVKLSYDVKHSPVTGFEIEVPLDYEVIEVKGKGVADWKIKDGVIKVSAGYEVKGGYDLTLRLESQRRRASGTVSVPEVQTRKVERETGHIAVVTSASLEVKTDKIENLMPMDVSELPSKLRSKSGYPLLYAFRYVRHPYSATITVKRHEEMPVLNAAIDIINLVTIFTNDGKSVTRIIYELRNNKKQYVKIDLPEKAKVWSAYLDDRPVKPTRNNKGQVLVPLKKSGAQKRVSFTVELIYYAPINKMEDEGTHLVKLPRADIPASELLLSLYLPPHYNYEEFDGDLEKIEEIQAQKIKEDKQKPQEEARVKRKIYSKRALNRQAQMEKEIAEQVQQQAAKPAPPQVVADRDRPVQRHRGMLPVKFNVPLRGKPFRFSKLIIMDESPELSFNFEKEEEKDYFTYVLIGILAAALVFIVALIYIARLIKKKE